MSNQYWMIRELEARAELIKAENRQRELNLLCRPRPTASAVSGQSPTISGGNRRPNLQQHYRLKNEDIIKSIDSRLASQNLIQESLTMNENIIKTCTETETVPYLELLKRSLERPN